MRWGRGAALAHLEDTPDSLGHTRSWAPPRLAPGAPSTPPPSASLQTGNLAQDTEIPGDWFRSMDPSHSREHLGCVLSVEEETLQRPCSSDHGPWSPQSCGGGNALGSFSHLPALLSPLHTGLRGWGRAGQSQTAGKELVVSLKCALLTLTSVEVLKLSSQLYRSGRGHLEPVIWP